MHCQVNFETSHGLHGNDVYHKEKKKKAEKFGVAFCHPSPVGKGVIVQDLNHFHQHESSWTPLVMLEIK